MSECAGTQDMGMVFLSHKTQTLGHRFHTCKTMLAQVSFCVVGSKYESISSFVILSNHATLGLSGTHTSINEKFWILTSCHEDVLVIVHLGLLVFNYAEIIPSSSI